MENIRIGLRKMQKMLEKINTIILKYNVSMLYNIVYNFSCSPSPCFIEIVAAATKAGHSVGGSSSCAAMSERAAMSRIVRGDASDTDGQASHIVRCDGNFSVFNMSEEMKNEQKKLGCFSVASNMLLAVILLTSIACYDLAQDKIIYL